MITCKIDSREQLLFNDLIIAYKNENVRIEKEMLTIGDIMILNDEHPILLIERKSVRDLVQSLKDGRYHDQRRRWKQFQENVPDARVSIWIEGDLFMFDIDQQTRSSLLNSLLRLQSIHSIIVYQTKDHNTFVQSLGIILDKFIKDPNHLTNVQSSTNIVNMRIYKKTLDIDENVYWKNCLSIIPNISMSTAIKISETFPSLVEFIDYVKTDPKSVLQKLASIQISTKRKLGSVASTKIIKCLTGISL